MSIPEIVVCRDEPKVCRISGYYMIVFQRDPTVTPSSTVSHTLGEF